MASDKFRWENAFLYLLCCSVLLIIQCFLCNCCRNDKSGSALTTMPKHLDNKSEYFDRTQPLLNECLLFNIFTLLIDFIPLRHHPAIVNCVWTIRNFPSKDDNMATWPAYSENAVNNTHSRRSIL